MHPLELILQLQVGSDQAAVQSLPSIVSSLTPSHFQPSSHLQKWMSRVTSLIHSKHPGARWAGMCLALQTSMLNKDLMIEAAQGWISISLPMLSRNEAPPTTKMCIRLLEYIFVSAIGMPEFQRQLATPNVPKFSSTLLLLAEKSEDQEIRNISMESLTRLIPLYPTLHRQFHPNIVSFSLRLLDGSHASSTPPELVEKACSLHAVLHNTGGKVGAASLWRKSLDTALANAWAAFLALRTTFTEMQGSNINAKPTFDAPSTDPVIAVPLSLDRLKNSICLMNELLRAVTSRPVPVPAGELNKFALCLLRCTLDDSGEKHFDITRRALETSVIADIWKAGCSFVAQLARTLRHHLNPHLSRFISHITHHLEQPLSKSHRILFLRLLTSLLADTYTLHSPIPPTRLTKTILPLLATLLTPKAEVQQHVAGNSIATNKKGKKRARAYEGDEVFKVGRNVLCPSPEDRDIVEVSLEALDLLLPNPHITQSVQALANRLLVSLLLELPRYQPSTLSNDLSFHGRIYSKVLSLCNKHVLAGSSGWVNSAVGLVVNALRGATDNSEVVLDSTIGFQRELDVLLHPRLPPLLRSQPPVEAISLFRSENIKEDKTIRDTLGMSTLEDIHAGGGDSVVLETTKNLQMDMPPAQPLTSIATNVTIAPTQISTSAPSSAIPVPIPTSTISTGWTAPASFMATTKTSNPGTPPLPARVMSATHITPLMAPSKPQEFQQNLASSSTSNTAFGLLNELSSDEDEEMPEIDTRSDSD